MPVFPLPLIQAFMVCAQVFESRQRTEFLLANPFNTANCTAFPATRPLCVYADLHGLRGRYAISLQLLDDDGEIVWSYESNTVIEEADPLRPRRIILQDIAVTYPQPGRYDLVILANGASLAQHTLWARNA